ncbi:unnamed protein product [Lathyrus sativus]|nr:unnamed protein product [Lathyrus sativus]
MEYNCWNLALLLFMTCLVFFMTANQSIYGGGSYLNANTKCISNYFPHQHTNNCDTDILQPTKRKKKDMDFPNIFLHRSFV